VCPRPPWFHSYATRDRFQQPPSRHGSIHTLRAIDSNKRLSRVVIDRLALERPLIVLGVLLPEWEPARGTIVGLFSSVVFSYLLLFGLLKLGRVFVFAVYFPSISVTMPKRWKQWKRRWCFWAPKWLGCLAEGFNSIVAKTAGQLRQGAALCFKFVGTPTVSQSRTYS
jgi:hypothetical protein